MCRAAHAISPCAGTARPRRISARNWASTGEPMRLMYEAILEGRQPAATDTAAAGEPLVPPPEERKLVTVLWAVPGCPDWRS